MKPRIASIIDILKHQQKLRIRDLAQEFDVSEMTIRRDLTYLESKGLLVRSHGGGVAINNSVHTHSCDLNMDISPEKIAIGKLAVQLVKDGQTIMFDSGSTSSQVALNLPRDANITVATTSILLAKALHGSGFTLILLGGYVGGDSPSVYGPMTERLLRDLHVDLLFTGCDAANSVEGLYLKDLWNCSLWQAMTSIADRTVVVTESAKFKRRALARYALPSEVDILVTDPGISEEDKTNLEDAGTEVLIADDFT